MALANELCSMLQRARSVRHRTMRQFAEEEIVIPDGPFEGRKFRCSRQPYTGLWFDQVDGNRFSRFIATGPTQSGKTLSCFIIPTLYHLFELGEGVVCGVPTLEMVADKWRESFLPVIERTRYRNLIPTSGRGSRGGSVNVVNVPFANGATLKFMTGGGGDKSRAGYQTRVIVATEVDGMDESGGSSREADKMTQLEARTRAHGSSRRVYMECTVSTEQGRTWREYTNGTKSRIVLPCPKCHAWVSPEREHLRGWQGAASLEAARAAGAFFCPACGEPWSHEERTKANQESKLLHNGQTIDTQGIVAGEVPPTDTLGFRWSGVNNLFAMPGDLAADEWRAAHSANEENAEREMRQFVWSLPVVPAKMDMTALEINALASRIAAVPRGIIPATAKWLTAAIDLGKYLCHWIVVAWGPEAVGHIVDYGRIEVASDDVGVEKALLTALRQFRDELRAGWPMGTAGGPRTPPRLVFVDSGYMAPVVYAFCREPGKMFHPTIGRGTSQQHAQWYNRPTSTGSIVKLIGEGYHVNLLPAEQLHLT
ncbi:MAG: terminase gpA endonuclease subunit, partial [Tepidisphaeraceae bacterium]